jgi:hypothetical protein
MIQTMIQESSEVEWLSLGFVLELHRWLPVS